MSGRPFFSLGGLEGVFLDLKVLSESFLELVIALNPQVLGGRRVGKIMDGGGNGGSDD